MKAIIAAETKRAESLIEGFMGLPPETVDLATFNAAVLKQARRNSLRQSKQSSGSPKKLPQARMMQPLPST